MMFSASTLCIPSFWQRDVLVIPVQRAPADSHGKNHCALLFEKKKKKKIFNLECAPLSVCCVSLRVLTCTSEEVWFPGPANAFFFFLRICFVNLNVQLCAYNKKNDFIWNDLEGFFFYPRSSFEPCPLPPPPPLSPSNPLPNAKLCSRQHGREKKKMCMCKTKYAVLMLKCQPRDSICDVCDLNSNFRLKVFSFPPPSHTSDVFLPSMQCALHQLCRDGVPDGPSGHRQGHIWDTGCSGATYCHRCALQGVLTGHHADRQPEEVSSDFQHFGTILVVLEKKQKQNWFRQFLRTSKGFKVIQYKIKKKYSSQINRKIETVSWN